MYKRGDQEESSDPFEFLKLSRDLIYEALGHLNYVEVTKIFEHYIAPN